MSINVCSLPLRLRHVTPAGQHRLLFVGFEALDKLARFCYRYYRETDLACQKHGAKVQPRPTLVDYAHQETGVGKVRDGFTPIN